MPVVPAGLLDFAHLPGRRSADPLPPGLVAGGSVRVVRIAPGPRTPHRHPHSAEVCYVASGTGTAWEDDVATPVAPAPLIAPETASCARCWGQGRHFSPARNGEGLVPSLCEDCGGGGLVLA